MMIKVFNIPMKFNKNFLARTLNPYDDRNEIIDVKIIVLLVKLNSYSNIWKLMIKLNLPLHANADFAFPCTGCFPFVASLHFEFLSR